MSTRMRLTEAQRELLEDMVEALEGVVEEIARGLVPPERHGHYLAHRSAVKAAREALKDPPSVRLAALLRALTQEGGR